jgi:hypothetical protein
MTTIMVQGDQHDTELLRGALHDNENDLGHLGIENADTQWPRAISLSMAYYVTYT